ncbi:MAG: TVP38/TMEM64 family protein [Chthoniobacterales bacterium]|nr:TVP38/TMEM64 family protein [Chthoniobacterales bacterium]
MAKPASSFLFNLVSLGIIAVTLLLVALFVPVVETVTWAEQKAATAGAAGPIIYPFLIAVCNLLLLPGGVLSFGSGLLFGLWWGFFLVLVGNMFAAAAAFWIGRVLGRKRIERLLRRQPKWAHLDESIEHEGWKIVVLSQLHPFFPVSLINYIYGITSIRFWPCLMWTLIGRAPAIFLYVYLGTLGQFGLNLMQGRTHPRTWEYLVWGGGLLLLLLLTWLLGRLAARLLAEAEAKAEQAIPPVAAIAVQNELTRAAGAAQHDLRDQMI